MAPSILDGLLLTHHFVRVISNYPLLLLLSRDTGFCHSPGQSLLYLPQPFFNLLPTVLQSPDLFAAVVLQSPELFAAVILQ